MSEGHRDERQVTPSQTTLNNTQKSRSHLPCPSPPNQLNRLMIAFDALTMQLGQTHSGNATSLGREINFAILIKCHVVNKGHIFMCDTVLSRMFQLDTQLNQVI